MAEHDRAETATGPPAAAGARPPGPHPWQHRAAMLAGSTTALVLASLAGSALGFLNKAACRSGDWNVYLKQFQAHCYTDIYPLYFNEQLVRGQGPYTGHPVEYPVLIGAAMQAVAWLVHPFSTPYVRGREFFDVTVLMLTLCAVAGTLATAYLAGRSRRWTALGVALAPGLILASFINWDLAAMALVALGMAAWAARRTVLAGVLLGLAVATKFYPLLFFGPLLLLCLRAGRMRAFWITTGSAAVAWLVVNLPVAVAAPIGLGQVLRAEREPSRRLGLGVVLLRDRALAVRRLAHRWLAQPVRRGGLRRGLRAHRCPDPHRAAPPPGASGVLPRAGRVPAEQQGVVTAVRDLAGPAGGAGEAATVGVCGVAGGRGHLLLRHLGLPDHHRHGRGPGAGGRGRHQPGGLLRRAAVQARRRADPHGARGPGHPGTGL